MAEPETPKNATLSLAERLRDFYIEMHTQGLALKMVIAFETARDPTFPEKMAQWLDRSLATLDPNDPDLLIPNRVLSFRSSWGPPG